jgi:transcriptional regulator with GAF, ATPase, and Fis domain
VVRENAILKAGTGSNEDCCGLDRLVGESDAMRKVREQVRAVASSHGTVLITGESGVGKEVVARVVHDLSPRAHNPFLAVNCAALNESLLESELFGHEKGAFTGADKLRKGRFELANDGTLLLDEVSEVTPQIQAKLLRVLQERAFERVGSSMTIGVDVRIIATSNRDLPHAASMGEFRQDLFYRLNVLPISIPPLRERAGDVELLAQHFVDRIAQRDGRKAMSFSEDARRLLNQYSWPGNVRELQNICERAVVLSDAKTTSIAATLVEPWLMSARPTPKATPLRATGLGESHAHSMAEPKPVMQATAMHATNGVAHKPVDQTQPGDRTLADIERETIVATLQRFNGHRQKTAKALGIGVRTLGLKLKKWKEESLVSQSL